MFERFANIFVNSARSKVRGLRDGFEVSHPGTFAGKLPRSLQDDKSGCRDQPAVQMNTLAVTLLLLF